MDAPLEGYKTIDSTFQCWNTYLHWSTDTAAFIHFASSNGVFLCWAGDATSDGKHSLQDINQNAYNIETWGSLNHAPILALLIKISEAINLSIRQGQRFFLRPYGSTTWEKSPAQGFLTRKKQSLQYRGKIHVGILVKKSISPVMRGI